MRRLLCMVVFLLPLCCLAQRENTIWYFGNGAGVDFATTPPTPLLGPIITQEGTASVCDASTGAFLFATDGKTIFDRNLSPMPNGTGLEGGWSSTQSALIIPKPRDSGKFYVFTAGDLSNGTLNDPGLHYTIVDMALNGGLGDVSTTKNVELLDSCAEKLHATLHCDGESYWVVAHHAKRPRFYMYLVTPLGVQPPIVCDVGMQYTTPARFEGGNYGLGMLKFSASGTMLAMANPHSKLCEVFNVDLRRGSISNPRLVDTASAFYGLSFSPNERILYVTTWNEVLQYDLSTAPINSSRSVLGTINSFTDSSFCGGIQRGPDGSIYIADSTRLQPIPRPDSFGAACGYLTTTPVVLRSPTSAMIGLPNIIDGQYLPKPIAMCPRADFTCDAVVCSGETMSFINYSSTSSTVWTWHFPTGIPSTYNGRTPPAITFTTPGVTKVMLIASNAIGFDTIEVEIRVAALPTAEAGADVAFCAKDVQRLRASGCVRYAWEPASQVSDAASDNPTITATQTTTYYVTGWNEDGCSDIDTVVAEFLDPAPLIMNNVQCHVSQQAEFVIQHVPNYFDSADVSLRFSGSCMNDVVVRVGEELARGSMPDGRRFLRMRLRKREADNIVAAVSGTALLNPVPYDNLECVVESSYGCREVSGTTVATLEFTGCALILRNILLNANARLRRTIYAVDGRVVQSDDVQYDRWEEQPTMPATIPAGLYIEVLALEGSVIHQRTFARGFE